MMSPLAGLNEQALLTSVHIKYIPFINWICQWSKRSLHQYADIKRYSPVNSDQPITYEEKSQTQSFHKILAEHIEEIKLISALVTNS